MAKNKERVVFTKEQLVKSKKYMRYVDFLNGNLRNDKTYTIEQVDKLISNATFFLIGKSNGKTFFSPLKSSMSITSVL